MNKYLNHLEKNGYSKNTITTYKNIIFKYENDWNDIRKIKKHILLYKNSPNTIWTHYNTICSYMKFNKDKRLGLLKELKLPPIPIKYREVFKKEYLLKKTEDQFNQKKVIIRFLFETGLRASELNDIIEIKKYTLIVKGKGNKIREIFHNPKTTNNININLNSFTTKTLRIWVKEILGNKFTPHSIRRSHATHMLLKGADPKSVMMQLGHTKIETTYKYLHISLEQNKKIYNKYF